MTSRNRPTVIAGGKVDVEALFGAQAKKRTKRKSGTLTVPRANTLTHADSFALSVTMGPSLDAETVTATELERMQAAEMEQTETDGFWGFDKERIDMEGELVQMIEEDKTSAENERLWSISYIQQQWEREEIEKAEHDRITAAVDEEHARLAYMEAFYSTESSGGIMAYSWPTRPSVTVQPEVDTATGPAAHKQGFDIHCSDYGNISTIHVNGMQRTQEISAGGETAPPSESQNVAALAMRPPGTRKTAPPGKGTKTPVGNKTMTRQMSPRVRGPSTSNSPRLPPSPGKEQQLNFTHDQWDTPGGQSAFTTGAQSQRQGPSRVNLLDLASRYIKGSMMVAGAGSKHNALYDGHPIYRWDQEQILRVVFSILDDNNVGCIGRSQISEVARNADIQDLLKFTVFWLPLKRRQWTFFYGIFDDESETIGVEEWLSAARDLAASEEVKISNVRLDEEQRSIADSCSVTGDWSEARFASETRSQIDKQQRAAATLRLVAPGDLVWALYSKGCRWLPARVLTVNNSDGHSLGDSSLTVEYILSTHDFKRAQSDTSTREFLPKPNAGSKQPQEAAVKPFKTEEQVCSYVFDLIDEDCQGVVKSSLLASKLADPVLNAVVNTSAVLWCLVKGEDDLLKMMAEMFPGDEGEGEEGGGEGGDVTKQEFIEFCAIVGGEELQQQ